MIMYNAHSNLLHLFQRNNVWGTQKTFYKFVFFALFLMVCIIMVFSIFLSALKLGDSGYDIEHEATTSKPSTTTSN